MHYPVRVACSLIFANLAFAQMPNVVNAKVQTSSASAGLEAALKSAISNQNGALWIGYAVPIVKGEHQMCCWNDGATCTTRLESGQQAQTQGGTVVRPIPLEGARELTVLLRIESQTVGKVRVFTPDCQLDGGGLPFHWLQDVRPAESVRYLLTLATSAASAREEERRNQSSVSAIALHAEPSADAALQSLAAPNQPDSLRKKAIFWMGNSRGRSGFQALDRTVREDPNEKIREHAVFALSQSKEPAAIPRVIQVAREDKAPHVRGQALFWLAQRAGRKVAEAELNHAIDNDPEVEVKKKAVFGLSQLPDKEGVPLLIQVARTNRNPAVRKQALFWLGQSKDPRALSFFEDVLSK